MTNAVDDGAFPGCVVAVGTSQKILWLEGIGYFDYTRSRKAAPETVYDLASVTKVTGTTSVIMKLSAMGKIDVHEPVSHYLPEFPEAAAGETERAWRNSMTVEQLMRHTGGLVSWRPFFREVDSYDDLLRAVMATPLEREPGTDFRYSDPGFILLGEIAARAGNRTLPELERELVFSPLGMRHSTRNPPPAWRDRIPPTEKDPQSGEFIHGVVHDENARAAGGGTGHAGLFSTAGDLALLARDLLRSGEGSSEWMPRETLLQFTRRSGENHRGLGWALSSGSGPAGTLLSTNTFGHTGFTGTSIWIDPDRGIFIILLTNRVHPTRDNNKIGPVRSALADAVALALE